MWVLTKNSRKGTSTATQLEIYESRITIGQNRNENLAEKQSYKYFKCIVQKLKILAKNFLVHSQNNVYIFATNI